MFNQFIINTFKNQHHLSLRDNRFVLSLIKVLSGSLFIAVCAQITVPFWPVPMTMQPFAILVIGLTMQPSLAGFTVLAYICEACFNLPVLAGFSSGIHCLYGPTGGYIIGFLPMVYIISKFKSYARSDFQLFMICLLSQIPLYVLGLACLAQFVGLQKSFALGFYPFLLKIPVSILLALFAKKTGIVNFLKQS